MSSLDELVERLEQKDVSAVEDISDLLKTLCVNTGTDTSAKRAHRLVHDHEVQAFLESQDSFAFNLLSRVAPFLLKTDLSAEQTVAVLKVIQGLCVLHGPSRSQFQSAAKMSSIISLLGHDDENVQIACIEALPAIMVRAPANIRRFEDLGGLGTICKLFKAGHISKKIKLQILEFLFFYLIPETHEPGKKGRKTTAEKSMLLNKFLSNVSGLVRQLNTARPFGDLNGLEW